jgi:hypothetical protein
MSGMEEDGQTYLLPHPAFTRVILTLAGLFALFIAPYELWRGVWPPNLLSPFFGFIMFGGMSVGAAFVWAGLAAPSGSLVFHNGRLEVHQTFLRGTRSWVIKAAAIEAVEVEESISSDGPNDWYAVIRAVGQKPIGSRPLATREAAENLARVFRGKLGLGPDGGPGDTALTPDRPH